MIDKNVNVTCQPVQTKHKRTTSIIARGEREVGGKRKRKRERAVINVMSIMIRSTTTQPSKVSASVLAVSRVPQESKKKQERDKTD